MSGLIDSLSTASRSLSAQQLGLDVTGQNIANLNTPGYTRRTVDLVQVAGSDARTAGGVDVAGVRAQRDTFLAARLRSEMPAASSDGAVADALSVVEASLGSAGSSLDGQLTAFFDAFSALAQDPTSAVGRDNVLLQGRQLASAFNDMSDRLSNAAEDADDQVRSAVDQINTLTAQVAELNVSLGAASGADAESVRDRQQLALEQLASLADISVMQNDSGGVDVSIGNGRAVVVGGNQYALIAGSAAVTGATTIMSGSTDITSEITSGSVGGQLSVRDSLIPTYAAALDEIAFTVADQVNTLHEAGFDLNGGTGNDFFVPLAGASGAASLIAVDPTLAADASLVSASTSGAVGDNATAKAIANLRDARVMSGGTATVSDAWGNLVYRVGTDSASAKADAQTRDDVIATLTRLRDAVSGVSLDEEAANLMKFQRAYQANARYFTTVNSTLDVLFALVGG